MLPPPSLEQSRVLEKFRQGKNLVVTAVAGAGKSTLLLHACATFPDEEIVVLAYNAPLAAEMNQLLEAAGLVNAKAYTFHSLASQIFRLCPDDTTMFEIVQEAHRGGAQPRKWMTPKHLLLDEMQDMRDLFWEVLNLAFDLPSVHTLICGDPEQMLYDFETDDAAKLDYLQRPEAFFRPGVWLRERLSVSFRLTPPVAALVNVVKDGEPLVAGNTGPAFEPVIVTCGMFEWTSKLLGTLRTWLTMFPPSKIAILVRSVRTAHPAVRTFINNIVGAGIPVYVHGVDAAHAQVRHGKIAVATHYAAKGLTFEACMTLGAAEGVDANPMYVAVSRSRCRQVLVLDRMRPPQRVLQGLRDGSVAAVCCAHTKQLVKYGHKAPSDAPRSAPALNDVSFWEPRGRAPEVHASIGTTIVSVTQDEPLTSECFAEFGEMTEEVAEIYVLGALMAEEHRVTGRCQRLEQVMRPQKASMHERTKRARDGDGTRLVDERSRNDELFPERLRSLVRSLHVPAREPLFFPDPAEDEEEEEPSAADGQRAEAVRWCAAAIAATAFGHYHHKAARLLTCLDWVDADRFTTIRERIRTRCLSTAAGRSVSLDAMIRHIGPQTVTQFRCHALVGGDTAWLVVFADHIGPGTRVRACVPAAVSDEVRTCCVLNVRTGETQTYTLTDRHPLRSRMDLEDLVDPAQEEE